MLTLKKEILGINLDFIKLTKRESKRENATLRRIKFRQ